MTRSPDQQRAFDDWVAKARAVSPVAEIIGIVAVRHGFTRAQIIAYGRTPKIARTRQVAMYLASRHTGANTATIARRFRRDQSTILHGIRRIEWLMRCDAEFAADIAILNEMFGGARG